MYELGQLSYNGDAALITAFHNPLCVFIIMCAFSWNKNKKLNARMHGVETSKKLNCPIMRSGYVSQSRVFGVEVLF